jgi:hypothetical protein
MDKVAILSCMQRHLAELIDAVNEGRDESDLESTLHHIGHIGCNMMFYSYHHVIKK